MAASHSIDVDPRGVVRYTLAGFFDQASLASLKAERAAKLPLLETPPNQHVTLCDVSQCAIQSQDALATLRAMLAEPQWQARMQVRRVVPMTPNVRWFDDRLSAEAWLEQVDPA